MDTNLLIVSLLILSASIFTLAGLSIGIECYNQKEHQKFKNDKMDNYGFLIFTLGSVIIAMLSSFYLLYRAVSTKSVKFYPYESVSPVSPV